MSDSQSPSGFVFVEKSYNCRTIWENYSLQSALVESGFAYVSGVGERMLGADDLENFASFSEAFDDVLFAFNKRSQYEPKYRNGFLFLSPQCCIPTHSEGREYWVSAAKILSKAAEHISAAQWLYKAVQQQPDMESEERLDRRRLCSFLERLDASAWPNAEKVGTVFHQRDIREHASAAQIDCKLVTERMSSLPQSFEPAMLYGKYFAAMSAIQKKTPAVDCNPDKARRGEDVNAFLARHRATILANEKIEDPKIFGRLKAIWPNRQYAHLRDCAKQLGAYLDYATKDPDAHSFISKSWRYRDKLSLGQWLDPKFMTKFFSQIEQDTPYPSASEMSFNCKRALTSTYSEALVTDDAGRANIADQIRTFSTNHCTGVTADLLNQVADTLDAGSCEFTLRGDLKNFPTGELSTVTAQLRSETASWKERFFNETAAPAFLQIGYNLACIVDGHVADTPLFPVKNMLHQSERNCGPRDFVELAYAAFSHRGAVNSVLNARNELAALLEAQQTRKSVPTQPFASYNAA